MTLSTGALTGEQVYLRRAAVDDAKVVHTWHASVDFMRYLSMGAPRFPVEQDFKLWFESEPKAHDGHPMIICLREGDQPIGICAYKDIFWQAQQCKFWMGIGETALQGKGYGTDALRVLLRYGFLEMNMQRIGLEVGEFNSGAIRAYEKAGFTREGTLRRFMFREGRFWDMHLMGILREEWEAHFAPD